MKLSLAVAAVAAGSNLVLPTYANPPELLSSANLKSSWYVGTPVKLDRIPGRSRHLIGGYAAGHMVPMDSKHSLLLRGPAKIWRRLSAETAEDSPSHSLHLTANEGGLPSSCVKCKIAISISQSPTCNTTEAHDNSVMIKLQNLLTYFTNANGSTDGWQSQAVRELLQQDNSTSSKFPISLADVLTATSAVVNLFEEVTGEDYKVAVYMYDMDDEPAACATLEPASEEESQIYEELFYPSAASVAEGEGGEVPVGASNNGGRVGLVSAAVVVGVSLLMSAVVA